MYGAALATLLPHCHALRVSGHRLAKCVITSPQFRPGSFTARPYFDGSVAPKVFRPPGVLRKRRGDMKRLLMMSASLLACATVLSSTADAQSIECAAEVPTPPKGQWYYRLIDGRKCWYEGKPMLPKSSLRWPKDPPVEAEGRSCDATSRSRPHRRTAETSVLRRRRIRISGRRRRSTTPASNPGGRP